VVDAVHAAGGRIAPQLWHHGVMRAHGTGEHPEAVSMRPSGLWGPLGRHSTVPQDFIENVAAETRPMTEEEIGDVIQAYALAARNARSVGFDAIAIHGAHGYMVDDFLWSETNRRNDDWGGDIARRGHFPCELVRAIRREIGEDMPIIFRFSQWKQQDFNARLADSPEELEQVLGPMADAGVDVFDASTRRFDQPAFEGSDLSLAGWARKVTGKHSMAVGSVGLAKALHDEDAADVRPSDNLVDLCRIFERGDFDLIGIGRMMLTHPDWVKRLRTGQEFDRFDASALTTLY
jgi:2,4-dienoyl-CoA reductase-like NADH-dependent reductase (Old Yellow Enzyme family)